MRRLLRGERRATEDGRLTVLFRVNMPRNSTPSWSRPRASGTQQAWRCARYEAIAPRGMACAMGRRGPRPPTRADVGQAERTWTHHKPRAPHVGEKTI